LKYPVNASAITQETPPPNKQRMLPSHAQEKSQSKISNAVEKTLLKEGKFTHPWQPARLIGPSSTGAHASRQIVPRQQNPSE